MPRQLPIGPLWHLLPSPIGCPCRLLSLSIQTSPIFTDADAPAPSEELSAKSSPGQAGPRQQRAALLLQGLMGQGSWGPPLSPLSFLRVLCSQPPFLCCREPQEGHIQVATLGSVQPFLRRVDSRITTWIQATVSKVCHLWPEQSVGYHNIACSWGKPGVLA